MKKILPPVIITIILIVYFILFISGVNYITEPLWFRLTAVIVLLAFIGVSIYVLIERIKEIRSGEEDDLSKY